MINYLYMGLSLLFMLVLNSLANIIPFAGVATAEISDKYLNYFTPAGYVFSIWGLIYFALIVQLYILYKNRKKYTKYVEKIMPWYVIGAVSNGLWMLFWHYDILLPTVILMTLILVSLLRVYTITEGEKIKKLVIQAPNSLYLGWISVATIANISAYITSLEIISDYTLTIAMAILLVVAGLGTAFTILKKDYVYPTVLVWAVAGIIVKFNYASGILYTGIIAIAIILGAMAYTRFKKK